MLFGHSTVRSRSLRMFGCKDTKSYCFSGKMDADMENVFGSKTVYGRSFREKGDMLLFGTESRTAAVGEERKKILQSFVNAFKKQ